MKFLHIIQLNERNTYHLFRQLHDTYNLENHTFLVMNVKSAVKDFPKFQEFDNFLYLPEYGKLKKIRKIIEELRAADCVIFNSLLFNSSNYLLLFYLARFLYHNAAWVEWGGDLYNWKREEKTIKNFIINHINRALRKKMKVIGLTSDCDDVEVYKQFPECKGVHLAPLPFGSDRIDLLETNRPVEKKDGTVRVQVAHNSLQVNNHISILAKLERFYSKDIKIILPLSYGVFGIGGQYGGFDYKRSVIITAKSMFREKLVVMDKNIDIESYLRYLWHIDIVVFETGRPIGMANILYLMYMRKKIFLPSDSPQYKFFVAKGIEVYDTYQIPYMSYEEFSAPVKSAEIHPWVKKKFIVGNDIAEWGGFFEMIEQMSEK